MLHYIPFLKDFDIGNGVCSYLVNNLCAIYKERPMVCNIAEMYSTYFNEVMTENEFIQVNVEACNKIAEYFEDKSAK